jgi:hypothetical protein
MDCSWDELSLISDFLQQIAAGTRPFGPPPSKSKIALAGCERWEAHPLEAQPQEEWMDSMMTERGVSRAARP